MKFSDIWEKIIGVFSNQKKTSNIRFIDDSSQQQRTVISENETQHEDQTEESIQTQNSEDYDLVIDDELWEEIQEAQMERKEREANLRNNQQFMRKLDIIMRHNHKTHEYYYHGTALENVESIISNGLYLRDDKTLSVTAVREFDEMGLYGQRDIATEDQLFEWEKECLIEYSRNGGLGEKCVVIIDKPQEEDSIIKKVEETDAPDIASEWVTSRPKGVVEPKWIVGYVDKVSGSIVANPLYYDYEKIAKRIAELPEISSNILISAVEESEKQTKTSEINDRVAEIKSRQLERAEEKTIEQEDRWEF